MGWPSWPNCHLWKPGGCLFDHIHVLSLQKMSITTLKQCSLVGLPACQLRKPGVRFSGDMYSFALPGQRHLYIMHADCSGVKQMSCKIQRNNASMAAHCKLAIATSLLIHTWICLPVNVCTDACIIIPANMCMDTLSCKVRCPLSHISSMRQCRDHNWQPFIVNAQIVDCRRPLPAVTCMIPGPALTQIPTCASCARRVTTAPSVRCA